MPPAEIEPAAPKIRKPADPLLSPTPRRPETASSANDADLPLRGVRLTGVVVGPDLRIAIFAVTGTNSRVLSEGEALKGWRLDSISPEGVVLSGSAGNIVLKPQPDPNSVPPSPLGTVQSGQPGTAMAGVPRQPTAVTPIAVGNLSAATPVRTQGYSNHFPEYYSGYDRYYSWVWVTHGAGDGLLEFPSDLADAGTAISAPAFSVQASDASAALVTRGLVRSRVRTLRLCPCECWWRFPGRRSQIA